MPSPYRVLELVRRRLLIHRRGLAAACAAAVVWLVIDAASATPAPLVPLWTAAHDLPSGTVLRAGDFRRTGFAPGSVPAEHAADLRAVVGRTLVVPLGTGDVVAETQVMGNARLAGYPGRVAVALRIPDPDAVALLRAGDRVDLVASDPQQGKAPEHLVTDAAVLTVPRATSAVSGSVLSGRLVVFAVPAADADHVAAAGSTMFLTVIWTR
ncbi:MAG: hypothetical protein JWQ74_1030 [Marmoricola sp.]|nr:hypothetical protein [Marmoricola sp.]